MSPFAFALRNFRFSRGLRQEDVAAQMGVTRQVVSQMENDARHTAAKAIVMRAADALNLQVEEREQLLVEWQRSRRSYLVPVDAAMESYQLAYQFFERLERLSSHQVQLIKAVLELPSYLAGPLGGVEGRVRRNDARKSLEEKDM